MEKNLLTVPRETRLSLQDMPAVLQSIGYKAKPNQLETIKHYVALIKSWSSRLNLTSKRDIQCLESHIFDSIAYMAVEDFGRPEKILDIGSGAGFPGLVLSVFMQESEVALVESNRKKALFLNACIDELHLCNCKVLNIRAENLAQKGEFQGYFSVITLRSVGTIDRFNPWIFTLLNKSNPAAWIISNTKYEKNREFLSKCQDIDYKIVNSYFSKKYNKKHEFILLR